ncbi:uncharacterized protein BCR38DRAFT_336494 [Pseudomassariella vexata]|uniref:RRM domain-containing protein n=1 Tax=Pseudomassariella vexata TaxID=1141098 RepID=A0A1Y2ECA9_9PEZI|nr:uncharacterized protein BCR38DRAFT_336494 [Pseudomassariella vexata]ORY68896.1 hypothetical protein BCR38DRAFT_336494 [Pseudomassariella vexata]
MSSNYRGDRSNPENYSANIPEHLSTSVYILNLPPNCTVNDVLSTLKGTGKIWACNMNPPTATIATSAMKIVWWNRDGVDRLLTKSRRGEFTIRGYVPVVKMNRVRSDAQPPSIESRVLQVTGPKDIVNRTVLDKVFSDFDIAWDLDEFTILLEAEDFRAVEYKFASYRCQAASAMRAINRQKSIADQEDGHAAWSRVYAHWGVDPCA